MAEDWPFHEDLPRLPAWVDRVLGRVEDAAILTLPLSATAVIGAGLTSAIVEVGNWPLWLAALVGLPVAFAVVVGFCLTMGSDGHDFIVGSIILIVLAAIAFPALKRSRSARLLRERQRLEYQLHDPGASATLESPIRQRVTHEPRENAR